MYTQKQSYWIFCKLKLYYGMLWINLCFLIFYLISDIIPSASYLHTCNSCKTTAHVQSQNNDYGVLLIYV